MSFGSCGRCHDCGRTLSGDEWCTGCRSFRRYHEHGWGPAAGVPGGRCYGITDTIERLIALHTPRATRQRRMPAVDPAF